MSDEKTTPFADTAKYKEAMALGWNGVFGYRDNMGEALEYARQLRTGST